MKVKRIVVGPIATNTYLLYDEKDCVIIDPGFDFNTIKESIDNLKVKPKMILLTHGHFDHVGEVKKVSEFYNIPTYLSKEDYEIYLNGKNHALSFGLSGIDIKEDIDFLDFKDIKFNDISIKVFKTPGHTPGSVSFYVEKINALFSGDLIFSGSVGRTDLPGSSYKDLEKSIKNHIYDKKDDTVIFPGHGPRTNVAEEKKNNQFVKV
jgi:hydroxyacylglutathione hydrolase